MKKIISLVIAAAVGLLTLAAIAGTVTANIDTAIIAAITNEMIFFIINTPQSK